MTTPDRDDKSRYAVVVNEQQQYSIRVVSQERPAGWEDVDVEGSKAECLEYIEKVWTDMRPLSLRRAIGADISPPAFE